MAGKGGMITDEMAKLLPLWVPTPKLLLGNAFRARFCVRCSDEEKEKNKKKRLSKQSSWEAKDAEGRDYLYRLGKEADNMNIAVGQRAGVIDDLFAGNFLGKDCNHFFPSFLSSSTLLYKVRVILTLQFGFIGIGKAIRFYRNE